MISKRGTSNSNVITRISVDNLFGRYTYEIPDPTKEYADLSRLIILYGDNGSGKTTILRILYNLVSSAAARGHRTFLVGQRFKKFAVSFADGTCVAAERRRDNLEGAYDWSISKGDRGMASVYLQPDERNVIARLEDEDEAEYTVILRLLSGLNTQLYFLSDDRKILGSAEEYENERDYVTEREIIGDRMVYTRRVVPHDESKGLLLDEAIQKVVDLIRNQVLKGASLGETNVNTIYAEVTKRIAKYPRSKERATHRQVQELLEILSSLARRSHDFSELRLMPPLNIEEITNILRDAPRETQAIIYNVLKPYVDGTKARLDALEETKDLITTFLRNITEFYVDKSVSFDPSEGLIITSYTGENLNPDMLSSGEKQLLLIFCHTLAARQQSSIFIIDEPEISLNVKWQRQLIKALLECVGSSSVQFLLATHAIELLTQHRQHVIKLVNIAGRH